MKYPKCECKETRFDYLRRRYKNGTLHMFRKCPQCGKVAQNAMRQDEYDANWVDSLPIMANGVMENTAAITQSRADAMCNPGETRNCKGTSRLETPTYKGDINWANTEHLHRWGIPTNTPHQRHQNRCQNPKTFIRTLSH